MNQVNRRDFVTAAAAAAGLGALGVCGGLPSAIAQTTRPSGSAGLDVGAKSDYTADGANMKWATKNHLIVMREKGIIYAMSSKCTHAGCIVKDAGSGLHCPCHNSDFNYDGTVVRGPAARHGPLLHFAISVNDQGHLLVDVQRTFKQNLWNDPAAFVPVDAA